MAQKKSLALAETVPVSVINEIAKTIEEPEEKPEIIEEKEPEITVVPKPFKAQNQGLL